MSNLNVNTITPLAGNTGTVSVSGSLYVKNDVSLGGNITFGDAATDTIKYVADVSSSIIPDQSSSYDLGSSTQMWNKAYIQELSGSSGKRSITSSVDIVPGLDNTYNLGSSVLEWNDLHVDGTANLDNTDIDGTFTMDGGTFDVNATGLVTISGSGITLDSIGVAANFTVASDGAAEDLTIGLTGATDSSIVISSTGTGADAINIDTTAGSIDIDSADNITVDAADEISLTTTSADGHISLVSAHTAGDAVHIDANADADSILNIDAGILDLDTDGKLEIDSVGAASHILHTATAGGDFTVGMDGSADASLILSSTGTGADALQITTTAGGIDISATGNAAGEDIDISSATSVNITATEDAANAIYLRANGGTSETIKIHSDQGTGAGSVEITSDAGSIDINSGDNITVDAADDITVTADNVSMVANVTAAKIQSPTTAVTATDAGAAIPAGTAVALVNADSDANHIVILPAPVVGNIIHIIENGTTGYELRTSTPASIGINGGTASNGESAIAGAITYVRCVCVSSTSWIATQFDADGDESKVEAAA